jgi:hypothetical protein
MGWNPKGHYGFLLCQRSSMKMKKKIRSHLLGGAKSQSSNKLIADAAIIYTDSLSILWIVCIGKVCT